GIVCAGEDVAGAAHVGRKLIDLVKAAIDDVAAIFRLAQVHADEIVGCGIPVFGEFEVDAANPESFPLQSLNEMGANKTAGSAHQGRFGLGHHADSRISAVALMNASGAGRREGAPVLVGGLASSVPQTPGASGNVMVNCEVGQTVR